MTEKITDEERQLLISQWRESGMTSLLNIHLVDLAKGKAVLEAFPSPRFYNTMGRLHGGYVATLMDTTLGCAAQSVLGAEALFGTIEMNINFVRKIDETTGRLICTGTLLHAGRTMLTSEAKVADEAGKLYAHGTGTFLVYPK